MSIATEITRIQSDRDLLRTKAIELKLSTKADVDIVSKAITTTSNLDDLASAFDSIANQGSVSTSVKEGETYTIPKGYHDGTGTVSGVAGGGYGIKLHSLDDLMDLVESVGHPVIIYDRDEHVSIPFIQIYDDYTE